MKKREFYRLHSDVCKTLANPKRQEILDYLRTGEMTVNQLVDRMKISQANISQHLSILRSKGIVSVRREGINMFYSLANPKIIEAFDLISHVLKDSLADQTQTVSAAMKMKKE